MGKVKLIHEDLSYQIIGILYEAYNKLGGNLQERYYHNAIKHLFNQRKISCLEQVRKDIIINGKVIGRYYLDFLIEHKIVLEIKAKSHFSRGDIHQILAYLKKSNIQLGILANFSHDGVKFKRILRGFDREKSEKSGYPSPTYSDIREDLNQ